MVLGTLIAALLLALAFPASAQVLREDFWVPNDTVEDLVIVGDAVYLGGRFTQVGPATGAFVGLDATTGAALQPYPEVIDHPTDGRVHAVVGDGADGWYIGGRFSSVRGQPRTNLAHLDAAGNLTAWNPGVNVVGTVCALVRDPATGVVFAGGDFYVFGGQTRWNLAAFDASGAVTAFDVGYVDREIYALALQGNTIYAAGSFTNVAGQPRDHAASFNATTGGLGSWAPSLDGTVWCMGLHETTTATHVYLGGEFTHVSGNGRTRLAMVDGITGGVGSWNPGASAPVRAMALAGGTSIFNPLRVYVGGDFELIATSPRSRLALINEAGAVQSWDPGADNTVRVLRPAGNLVYVGGDFAGIGGQPIRHLAAIDANGAATSWDPLVGGPVLALGTTATAVFAGGQFWTVNGVKRDRLAALSLTTGVATSWNPGADGAVLAMTAAADTIYVGGSFTTIGGQPRSRLAAFDAVSGAITAWSPAASDSVEDLAVGPGVVYAGGAFTAITTSGGTYIISYLVALDAATGLTTAWYPLPDEPVHAVAFDGGTVYAGGSFSQIGGHPRWHLAALDAGTGEATVWNPAGPGSFVEIEDLAFTGPYVAVGGAFDAMGGPARRDLAFVDKSAGNANAWDPGVNSRVTGLAVEGSTIHFGGYFTLVGGVPRNGLAALDGSTGALLPYNPSFPAIAGPIVVKDGTVYAAGRFASAHVSFAVFSNPTTDVDDATTGGSPMRLRAAPNPFRSQVGLSFSLPRDGAVDVSVYDISGRLVRRLERGTRPAGEHRASWDGRDQEGRVMGAGVYLVRVSAESLRLTARVLRID